MERGEIYLTMRKYDLYWMENEDWYEFDESLFPRIKESAPPEAQRSYKRYLEQRGYTSICDTCPKMQEYYEVGCCPDCGADGLLMEIKTHIAVCPFCEGNFGIPLAIEGLCHKDVLFQRYELTLEASLATEIILPTSKILGINSVQLYNAIKTNIPIKWEVSYEQALSLKKLLSPLDITFTISPDLIDYPKYEECWGGVLV